MNVFRISGGLSHVFAVAFLLSNIFSTKSCAKISAKSQILYLIVFITRYHDLFTQFVTVYDSVMKSFFLLLSSITIYLVCGRYSNTYDRVKDSFWVSTLLILSAVLAYNINHEMSFLEILWTFSIYLESVAMVPQLFMIQKLPFQGMCNKKKEYDNVEDCLEYDADEASDGLGQYVPLVILNSDNDIQNNKMENVRKAYLSNKLSLSSSMVCHYIFFLGIYRLLYIFNWIYRYHYEGIYDAIATGSGCVQTLLYAQFFYFYVGSLVKREPLKL